MRKPSLIGAFSLLILGFIRAQPAQQDTTIYEVAEIMPLPLLAKCQPALHPEWPDDSIRHCSETQLLAILAANIRYPEEAREKNIEGTVVTSFVVEPNGRISNIQVLRDIGGGCGPEAARVLAALDEAGLRWRPAMLKGKTIRMKQALPLRFKLQEALPYYVSATNDTIYTQVDSLPDFRGGVDSLISYVMKRLEYPVAYRDSCKTGIIEMALVILPNGNVKIDNQLDFNNLGMDFQWQAVRMANRSSGHWKPAIFQGRPVATTLPLRALFKSDLSTCQTANSNFDQAMLLADEGAKFSEQNESEKAIEKWNAALALQPDNTELLYYRGSALLALDRKEEACKDFDRIKKLLGMTWFEQLRRLVCGG